MIPKKTIFSVTKPSRRGVVLVNFIYGNHRFGRSVLHVTSASDAAAIKGGNILSDLLNCTNYYALWQPMGQEGNNPLSSLPKAENKKPAMVLHCPNTLSLWPELFGKTFPALPPRHLCTAPTVEVISGWPGSSVRGAEVRLRKGLPLSVLESEPQRRSRS